MNFSKSEKLFEEAKKVMPGGVNSPVRAFKSVGMTPIFIDHGKGNRIYDVDGNEYIDFIGSWGPMILGHSHPSILEADKKALEKGLSFGASTEIEVEMAKLITENVSHVEMIRMVNSGTEAVMSAIRVARGYTGKDKIIKFEGCYHGHCDSMLVKAGSGAMTFGSPDSSGVTKGAAEDTLLANYNYLESVENLLKKNRDQVAAVIVEPVAANMGLIPPEPLFLQGLRDLCNKYDALLIFDEVITGFRLAFGGAAEYFGVEPDLVTYGKIIGGGMPVGAYGGKKHIMTKVSPAGSIYQAGTLSGNPIAMTTGITMLKILLENKTIYTEMEELGRTFAKELRKRTGYTVNQIGSLLCIYYTKEPVRNYKEATQSDVELFAKVFRGLIEEGIYTGPSQYEALFLNSCFTAEDIEYTVKAYEKVLKGVEVC